MFSQIFHFLQVSLCLPIDFRYFVVKGHFSQKSGFSSVWILSCFCSARIDVKFILQYWQKCGFSSVWVFLCLFRVVECLKVFLQMSQEKCFSPVWISSWHFKEDFFPNLWSQTVQEKGFSPVWIFSWFFSESKYANTLPQILQNMLHSTSLSSNCIWESLCLPIDFRYLVTNGHFSQKNGFSLVWIYTCFCNSGIDSYFLLQYWQ